MSTAEWVALRLSALVGLGAVAITLPPAVLFGYLLARREFRGKALLDAVLLLPLVLPPVVTGYALLVLFGRNGVLGDALRSVGLDVAFTWRGAVVASAVMAFPLAYRACRLAFEAVDPRLAGVARTLGATRLDAFVRVTLPLARGGLVAGAVLAFARSLGEFGATMVLAGNVAGETRTLPLAVWGELQQPGGLDGAWRLAVLAAVLSAGALLVGERLARRKVT
jgi:molybdate transport system permease protein